MDRPDALHDILEELHIASLDDSDVEVGLQSLISDDTGSAACETQGSFIEEASSDSAVSSEVRAALSVPLDAALDGGDTVSALEARLRISGSLSLPPLRALAPPLPQPPQPRQQQLIRSVQSLADAQAAQADELAEIRREREEREAREKREAREASAHRRPPAGDRPPQPGADATTALSLATGVFRLQMSDLKVSEAQYLALRERPEDELNIREWVQVRFYEARSTHKAEAERLRLEVEALRENFYTAQTKAERAERQLAQREIKLTHLTQELERQQDEAKQQLQHVMLELRAREREVGDIKDKGLRFDDTFQEASRLREELYSVREAMAAQTAAQQQSTKEHAECADKLLQLEGEHRLVQKDAEAHERRARLLEETLNRRDEEATELREKVASLREKKRELARKATADQASVSHDVREQVDVEIKRFQDQARTDLDAVRTNLNALHEKEVQMVQERLSASDARVLELQRRLDDEEHGHQQLQLSAGRVRADLQNEITELRGTLKLRAFETERAALTHEEISNSRQQLEAENEQLKQQVEILRKEYYTLEVQHREGRATERAELASLKEQLRGYIEVERELDAAIRSCSGACGVTSGDDRGDTLPPQSIDEALLIGTTLGGAPTSGQRRIQQSLLLAQEVQRRTRELIECRARVSDAQAEADGLREELEASKREQIYASEPQAYLLEALRRREQEVVDLKRGIREQDSELDRSRKQVEEAVAKRIRVEEDLRQLLTHRQHLESLQAVFGSDDGAGKLPPPKIGGHDPVDLLGPRAENRGRAPSQHSQAQVQGPRRSAAADSGEPDNVAASCPAWYQRLKGR